MTPMSRFIYLFMCVFVLAACSQRLYQREQVARTFNQETAIDSTSVRAMVDRLVHDEIQKQLDIQESIEVTSVKEVMSSPDSSGSQHVVERTTTTQTTHKTTSAISHRSKEEKTQEVVDSSRVSMSDSTMEKEEKKDVAGKVNRFSPWYIYAISMAVAVFVGFILYLRKRGLKFI